MIYGIHQGKKDTDILLKYFYKDSIIIIFAYEIINWKIMKIKTILVSVKSNSIYNDIFLLVENKTDLYDNSEVDEKEAEEWADSIGENFQTT